MTMRPTNRGFSRKVFDLLEAKGPMSRSTIADEMRKIGHPVTSKQIITCLQNMRQRHWIEYSQEDRRKYDIRSQSLRNQRDRQVQMLNQIGRVEIKPAAFEPSVSPTPDVKTPETVELRAVTDQKTDFVLLDESIKKLKGVKYSEMEALTVPLPIQVAGMISVTAIITAVSTAIAMRMF